MKKIRFLALLLLLATLLTGCGGGGVSETDTPDTQKQETTKPSDSKGESDKEPAEFITMFGKDSSKDYVIINGKHNAENEVNQFASKLMQKTGHSVKPKDVSNAVVENEIVIGYAYNRAESVDTYAEIASTVYDIRFVGKKLVVSAYTSDGLVLALDYLVAYIKANDDGEYGLMSDFAYSAQNIKLDYDVPKPVTKKGYVFDGSVSNSMLQLAYKNLTTEEVTAYGKLLKEKGFTEHSTNTIGSNLFASYYTDDMQVHTMFYPALKDFRIVFGKKGYLPSTTAPQFTRTNDVQLTQNLRMGLDNGMSYMLQLADGSFLIIDGGLYTADQMTALWNYVNTNKPASDAKPRITWMFTHAHNDHTQLAIEFMNNYSSRINLQMVCYNLPNTDEVVDAGAGLAPYIKKLKTALKTNYPNTVQYVYHSGQKLLLPGVEIEFMATQEDYWPLEFENENLTSNVWRMKFEDGRTLLIVGDLELTGTERLTKVYGAELESDIFQVNHHGKSGMTQNLINYVDPKICLWPTTKASFENNNSITGYQNNATLKANLKTSKWTRDDGTSGDRIHYHGDGAFIITFIPTA